MKLQQIVLSEAACACPDLAALQAIEPQLVLAFGSIPCLKALAAPLTVAFPAAIQAGCSTAGEISAQGVSDRTAVVTALHFDDATVRASSTRLAGMADSEAAGRRLAEGLSATGLRAVIVLGQGVAVNGSALIEGLAAVLGPEVPITGGLAGDAAAFTETWVLTPAGLRNDEMVCLGLYGEGLSIAHGSYGGWAPFGPARKVTRSDHNLLYELDGEPALDVYKRYLGDYAKDLPASGLLFPFAMLGDDHSELGLVRTILGVDEASGSLTLAGDIDPQGYLRLMHASTDALVDGAETAAAAARAMAGTSGPGLALLVSCVGRKIVMGDRVEEEIEAVAEVFGPGTVVTGFYSNGEISPVGGLLECKLHNQTMTITHLSER
jgi:hypothetical protein